MGKSSHLIYRLEKHPDGEIWKIVAVRWDPGVGWTNAHTAKHLICIEPSDAPRVISKKWVGGIHHVDSDVAQLLPLSSAPWFNE